MKDIMGMMKQVGQMQARLKEVQDELGRAEIEGQMEQMRTMFSLDQMKAEMKFRLPGDVIEAQGVKKDEKETPKNNLRLEGKKDSVREIKGMGARAVKKMFQRKSS